jgi:hypothetical protein
MDGNTLLDSQKFRDLTGTIGDTIHNRLDVSEPTVHPNPILYSIMTLVIPEEQGSVSSPDLSGVIPGSLFNVVRSRCADCDWRSGCGRLLTISLHVCSDVSLSVHK